MALLRRAMQSLNIPTVSCAETDEYFLKFMPEAIEAGSASGMHMEPRIIRGDDDGIDDTDTRVDIDGDGQDDIEDYIPVPNTIGA